MKKIVSILIAVATLFSILSTSAVAAGFSDVKTGSWYYAPVSFCQERGFVSGYKDGSFKPNNNITRAEFCVMLYMLANELALNEKAIDSDMIYNQYAKQYSDYNPNKWYSDAVASCLANGYISGTSKTTLSLDKYILRQDVAVMIDKMFGWTFEPNTHQGGLCNNEYTGNNTLRYWLYPMYRFIDLGIYKGDANWNGSKGSPYKNNYPITRAEMCTVFKFILENQRWIDARENTYYKYDYIADLDCYFYIKKDQADYLSLWEHRNVKKHYDKAEYNPITKNVQLDSVRIEVLDLTAFIDSVNDPSKPQTEIPNVVGKTKSEAISILLASQLELPEKNIEFVAYTGDPAGTVSYQIPEAGTRLNAGEDVFIMIAK